MDIDKFGAHGKVHAHFQAEQNILHIDLVGPFNFEFMQKYERLVGAQRKNIDTPCWGSLVNVHGLPLAPMEATLWLSEKVLLVCRPTMLISLIMSGDSLNSPN